jgi:heme-degrading monooxygenase HmoA
LVKPSKKPPADPRRLVTARDRSADWEEVSIMILEVAIMTIKPDRISEFEAVFPKAAAISASTPGYISHELQRCVESKGKYFYMIRWESIEAHMVNFRESPRRDEFRKILGDFWAAPNVTEHFEAVTDDRI